MAAGTGGGSAGDPHDSGNLHVLVILLQPCNNSALLCLAPRLQMIVVPVHLCDLLPYL
jgi:hypothetical protein